MKADLSFEFRFFVIAQREDIISNIRITRGSYLRVVFVCACKYSCYAVGVRMCRCEECACSATSAM